MPPKGKGKTINGHLGNASASGPNASDSCSTEPSAKSTASQLDDKTQTFAICKEMCKGMSESILEKLDEHFDAFETKFQLVLSVQTDL